MSWRRNRREKALNTDLWKKLLTLCERHQVKFIWVKGHAGNRENELCDQLSYAALKQTGLPADEGYEPKSIRQPRLNL